MKESLMERLRCEPSSGAQKVVSVADRTAAHPVFSLVTSLEQARTYMEFQVWCVWDFMCLAKAVQTGLGTFTIPWLPPKNGALLAAINEIISGEETDTGPDGKIASHFEIYLAAMHQAGADTTAINTFLQALRDGVNWEAALHKSGAHPGSIRYVSGTIRTSLEPLHRSVASFCLGREELVPMMLVTMLRNIPRLPELEMFRWYIQRHIALDAESHGPLSSDLFDSIAGVDAETRQDALKTAAWAIAERADYLDVIMTDLSTKPKSK